MSPPRFTTQDIVSAFVAGLTMHELARKYEVPLIAIEQAVRRWLTLYPKGKGQ
jgi:uncharacterized protein (DUF433 family)